MDLKLNYQTLSVLTLVRVILLCYSLEKYSFIKDNMFDYLMLHENFFKLS